MKIWILTADVGATDQESKESALTSIGCEIWLRRRETVRC
jgi:hypothetical protein